MYTRNLSKAGYRAEYDMLLQCCRANPITDILSYFFIYSKLNI